MKKNTESVFVVEHMFELRHEAVGKFLDVRGLVADYVKNGGIFPHWRIVDNSISFFDSPSHINNPGAIISYNKIGFQTYDPSTQNYFQDQALKFWKYIQKNNHYKIPDIERLGIRTKCYVPSKLTFNQINEKIYSTFFNEKSTGILGAFPIDLQLVFDIKEADFQVRITIGPVRPKEAQRYFSFPAKEFNESGIYLDMDYFKIGKISHSEINDSLLKAMTLTWSKIEQIKTMIGV